MDTEFLQPGKLVRCKAGGPTMVVLGFVEGVGMDCLWWDIQRGEFVRMGINAHALLPYDDEGLVNIP